MANLMAKTMAEEMEAAIRTPNPRAYCLPVPSGDDAAGENLAQRRSDGAAVVDLSGWRSTTALPSKSSDDAGALYVDRRKFNIYNDLRVSSGV